MPGLPFNASPSLQPLPPRKRGLLLKLSLILFLCTLPPTFLVSLTYLPELKLSTAVLGQIAVVFLASAAAGTIIFWRFLKPLDKIFEGAENLAAGNFNQRIDVRSGDEIESLAHNLNHISVGLSQAISQANLKQSLATAQSNELNAVLFSISEGVIVLDLNFKVVFINKAAAAITGLNLAEVKGQPLDNLIEVKDKDNRRIGAADYCPPYAAGQPTPPQTPTAVKFINRQKEEIEVEIVASPVSEEIQTNLGYVIIVHDLRQKKNLEQMQIDFVSMASHEIRTPLTSIISYLSTISEESQGKLDPELKVFLDRALLSAQQLSALTANLLNVSKIERGSFAMMLQPLDWWNRLSEVVETMRPQAQQKNITLTLNPPPQTLPNVLADNIRINEVINNLLANAINYTPQNGRIAVMVKQEGQEVTTSVIDNGPGVPPEAVPHLFTKFFRVAGSLEQMQKGTGLGLYLSKSIIDLHHGRIWVESQPGQGANFSFSLPVAKAAEQPTIAQLLHTSPT